MMNRKIVRWMNKTFKIQLASIDQCTGCAACVSACSTGSIAMQKDRDGFLVPKINKETCVGCHKCEKVCPIVSPIELKNDVEPKVYAAINKDEDIRRRSSSGGAFYALAKWTIEKCGVVFGAAFEGYHLKHQYAETMGDVEKMVGSKYIQSEIGDSYNEAKKFLKDGRWVLFTGTPCQIAGLKRYLGKDYEKLLTVDLLCHGVPSPAIWEKYMERQIRTLKAKDVMDIRFRTKREDASSLLNFYFFFFFLDENNVWQQFGEDYYENPYFAYFMRHLFRSSCYQCPFRSVEASHADLTIGDCWNVDKDHPTMSDNKGISTIILHTSIAQDVFAQIKQGFAIEDEDVSIMEERYEEAKREEREERKKRLWKLSNRIAQYLPLERMRFIYMHDRIDFVIKRKFQKIWKKNIK